MEKVKTVYKAMRKENGILKSVYAGCIGSPILAQFHGLTGVTYMEGVIAYAPEGQKGLAAFLDLAGAKDFCAGNHPAPMVIHEAIPLGTENAKHDICHEPSARTYPALLIGKEVWTDTPPKPKEEWVDVTAEITFKPQLLSPRKYELLINIYHKEAYVATLGLNQQEGIPTDGYKIEPCGTTAQGTEWFKVLKKVVK